MVRTLLIALADAGLADELRDWSRGGTAPGRFPRGTLIVNNVVGGVLIALTAELAVRTAWRPPTRRLTLGTGFIGGVTTGSIFKVERLRGPSRTGTHRRLANGAIPSGVSSSVAFMDWFWRGSSRCSEGGRHAHSRR